MSTACERFRVALEHALAGGPERLTSLGCDEHAQACAVCRAELARERGLERLLARVPVPEAPAELSRRVLAGLAAARRAPGTEPVPTDEPGAPEERDELDELLANVPAPLAPPGLASRVLAALASARAARPARVSRRASWLVAAGLLAAAALWAWWQRPDPATPPALVHESERGPELDLESDEELLAYAVEHWELLHDADLDVWLASLDPLDELLLEYDELLLEDAERWLDGAAEPAKPEGEGN